MQMNAVLFYRSLLDEHDKKIYDSLVNQWMHYNETIIIDKPHCDFGKLTQAIHWDYPLLFYINYYEIMGLDFKGKMLIKGSYLYDKSKVQDYLNRCEKWGKYIYNNIPKGLEKTEKALWLHDVILNNVRYSEAYGIRAHNLIGVVLDGTAVCEGISMAYKYLCDFADVACIYVSGMLQNEHHGWNMVWLDKGSSFVDVTNDIQDLSRNEYKRENFLRASQEMIDYRWDTTVIPECKLRNMDYQVVTVYSEEEFYNTLIKNSKAKSLTVHLKFLKYLDDKILDIILLKCHLNGINIIEKDVLYSRQPPSLIIKKKGYKE